MPDAAYIRVSDHKLRLLADNVSIFLPPSQDDTRRKLIVSEAQAETWRFAYQGLLRVTSSFPSD
eukprot:scaffold172534_cov37-Prasinocladus_malaysianus.AAC.1